MKKVKKVTVKNKKNSYSATKISTMKSGGKMGKCRGGCN